MKKTKFILSSGVMLLLFNLNFIKASAPIKPSIQKCQPYVDYEVTKVIKSRSEQYVHMSYNNVVSKDVMVTTKLTKTLSLTTGIEADLDLIFAKSNIKFELKSEGSKTVEETIIWHVEKGKDAKLVAGKEIADVTGIRYEMNEDCQVTKKEFRIEGSYHTYSYTMLVD